MTFESITNRAEFFSDHYLDARLATDLNQLREAWDVAEGRGESTARKGLRGLGRSFFPARAATVEANPDNRADAVRALNDAVLTALGFTPDRAAVTMSRSDGTDTLSATVAARVETPTGLLLVAIDAGFATGADEIFDTDPREDGEPAPGLVLDPISRDAGHVVVADAADAPGEWFSIDDPPRFVLICAGTSLLLAERAKWAEGRFLAVDLDAALERADASARGEFETIAALFSADALVAGHLTSEEAGSSFFDDVEDKSTRHAVGVSKELREGMRRSVEILANEVIQQRLARRLGVYDGENRIDPADLTTQCLRYLYRLIVLLYAESRPELGVLPTDDDAYIAGYSLDRLRELVLVQLDDEHARNGTHLDESLQLLFDLVNGGYHAEGAAQSLVFDLDQPESALLRSSEDYLQFPGLDATIFDAGSTPLLDGVALRNEALQKVLVLLMLNRETKRAKDQRGFISYAQLGINQLGAVYEGLMAYTGFFAREDLYEVAKNGDPADGTWMVPVTDADEYPVEVFVTATDPLTDRTERVAHARGSYVYRLAGRDRQRSASYYTPEVLTSCVVRHALAELLGTDEHARVPGGSAGVTQASEILELTICEPALGSGAFLNEAINQLSAEYLKRRQAELGETLDAERYQRELQKVKAHFALHQSYGVDLNATAVELAEVSLWLNCMYPGLKAPWFGLGLRRGNSLVGCRRATWPSARLKDRVWAKDKAADAVPPVDRPLDETLSPDEIHHFLLPGHGWGAVAGRKEAKELAPDAAKKLGAWRKTISSAPSASDADRLCALAAGVERLWAEATDVLDRLHQRMRRPLRLYGVNDDASAPADDRRAAEKILANPDSALGRLRLVMDAWIGLWFWPLDLSTGDAIALPNWRDWLTALELIIGAERAMPEGQLDLFADLAAIEAAEEARAVGRVPVDDVLAAHPWFERAHQLARREGAWHWELEFAPVLKGGGFDVQVGNPPWVKFSWKDDDFLAELDARVAVLDIPVDQARLLRQETLLVESARAFLAVELASAAGISAALSSKQLAPRLDGMQSNLYLSFIDLSWRIMRAHGVAALVHEDSVFFDPNGGEFRFSLCQRLRRACLFRNELFLFEELSDTKDFCFTIAGDPVEGGEFLFGCWMFTPAMFDDSLSIDRGTSPSVGIKTPSGSWDCRPSADRISVLTPSSSPLPKVVVASELGAISALGLAGPTLETWLESWGRGIEEDVAKRAGVLSQATTRESNSSLVILQGPHFSVANPLAKEVADANGRDVKWQDIDLEALPRRYLPRTGYRARADLVPPLQPNPHEFRLTHRKRTNVNMERALHVALLSPGPLPVGTCYVGTTRQPRGLAVVAGLGASIVWEYIVRVSGRSDITPEMTNRFPVGVATPAAASEHVVLRAMRLNCLTEGYAPLWEQLFNEAWCNDRWAHPMSTRLGLGEVGPGWTMATPLRRDQDRRAALIELDALAAIMLGLTAEQLCAIYRTQFAVLRKYEYAMAFDAEGRKICQYHQSAGYRQSQLQDEAKAGRRDPRWKWIWKMFEQWEEDPDSVDWEGQYVAPFTRVDREIEMTRAYNEFKRRRDAGECG